MRLAHCRKCRGGEIAGDASCAFELNRATDRFAPPTAAAELLPSTVSKISL